MKLNHELNKYNTWTVYGSQDSPDYVEVKHQPGLPDGIFSKPILENFGGSRTGKCGHIFGHLVYFTAIWYMSQPFGIFYGHFPPFGMMY
jgi:hypothetical protein